MSPSSTADGGSPATPKTSSRALALMQRVSRGLMMPIAVLPAAALLLRLGQDDMLGSNGPEPGGLADVAGMGWMASVAPIVGAAGNALFEALPLLFAVGVAIGFARRADGSTALAAVVGYLVFDRVTTRIFFDQGGEVGDAVTVEGTELVNWGAKNPTDVLGGILVGIITALLWQRYHRIVLPSWLGFFGGRRFVPIITALASLALAVAFGYAWPAAGGLMNDLGNWIVGSGAVGAGVYGMVNRLLLPFGLHHIVNSGIWFVFGDYHYVGSDGTAVVVSGEISRYLAGDPEAGGFLAGFFPVLMFGLPAAALAIWRAAHPSRRAAVGGIMVSAALTAFVTGITEPIEYAFLFVAPLLYGVHVVLTGASMALLNGLGAKLGFGFSAGGIDMLLNAFKSNTQGMVLILGMGVLYFVLYYLIFYFLITRLNLPTPGREPAGETPRAADSTPGSGVEPAPDNESPPDAAPGDGSAPSTS